jgi:cytochrome c
MHVNPSHYNSIKSTVTQPTGIPTMKRTLITLAMTLSVAAPAMADLALATSKNCMACHAVDKKLVGPSYKDVAAKYAGQKDAVDKLAAKIIKGGAGVWGPVPMPANAQVNDADAKKLAAWVMTHK